LATRGHFRSARKLWPAPRPKRRRAAEEHGANVLTSDAGNLRMFVISCSIDVRFVSQRCSTVE
jgi:hypothetical protein